MRKEKLRANGLGCFTKPYLDDARKIKRENWDWQYEWEIAIFI